MEFDEAKAFSLKDLVGRIKYVFNLSSHQPVPVSEFVAYVDSLDSVSGRSWRTTFPELRNLVE
jgi:hypothetical protein